MFLDLFLVSAAVQGINDRQNKKEQQNCSFLYMDEDKMKKIFAHATVSILQKSCYVNKMDYVSEM